MRRYRFLVIVLVALIGVSGAVLRWRQPPGGVTPEDGSAEEVPETLEASVGSGTFANGFSVELITQPEGGEIRYTLDDSEPTLESLLYSEPIQIDRTVRLAARRFVDGVPSLETLRHSYLQVDDEVQRFRSEIPVVLIETLGVEIQRYRDHNERGTPYVDTVCHVFEPDDDGFADISQAPSLSARAGVKARGSSTLGREKSSLTLEIRDPTGEDLDVSLLGLPAESDWILLGPLQYDRALIRNPLVYELTRQMGHYAPRTRFVEVFLNEDGGAIRGPIPDGLDYYGVYVLVEKIKRDTNRVAVEKLLPEDNEEPAVTGGYIIKIDRAGPGDVGFHSGGRSFHYVSPKERDISSAQAVWIEGYMDELFAALNSPNFSGQNGYARYLDVDAAIDYHIMTELTKNPDGYVYSTYLHKSRGEKLMIGPVWDYDRTMGCDHDQRAYDPRGWSRNSFRFWYRRLFQDLEFRRRYVDRWQELREGPLAYRHIAVVIEEMVETLEPAAERNTRRWGDWMGLQPGRWRSEIDQLKNWISHRLKWLDSAIRVE